MRTRIFQCFWWFLKDLTLSFVILLKPYLEHKRIHQSPLQQSIQHDYDLNRRSASLRVMNQTNIWCLPNPLILTKQWPHVQHQLNPMHSSIVGDQYNDGAKLRMTYGHFGEKENVKTRNPSSLLTLGRFGQKTPCLCRKTNIGCRAF